jgi:hypothetical protein
MADVRSVRRILIARAGRSIRQNQNGASPPLLLPTALCNFRSSSSSSSECRVSFLFASVASALSGVMMHLSTHF